MTLLILILGLISITTSMYAALLFLRYSRSLSGKTRGLTRAIAYQLWGEMVMVLGTLVFTIAAHFGWLPDWSITRQSSLRFLMFFTACATTVHLVRVMGKISLLKE